MQAVIAAIISEQPDYIVLVGDLLEASGASVHANEDNFSLAYEYAEAGAFLESLRKAGTYKNKKNAQCVFLPGNHDDNILAANRIPAKLRHLCDYRMHIRELENWLQPCEYKYDRNKGVFRLGQVAFAHGYETGAAALKNQAVLLGDPFGLTITGHTHQAVQVHQVMMTQLVPLPYWAANVGCLRDLKPDYVARKRTHNWSHAYVIGDCDPTLKSPRKSLCWSAQTEFIKISDDYLRPKFEGKYGKFAA